MQPITMLLAFKSCHACNAAAVVPMGTNAQTELHRGFANMPLTLHEAGLLGRYPCLTTPRPSDMGVNIL